MDDEIIDLLETFRHDLVGQLHTMMPGKIVSYDPTTQLATVQPMVQRVYWSDETVDGVPPGDPVYMSYPQIANVPIEFPGGSTFVITWALGAGDTVDLVFAESSPADYFASGQESPQQDIGRHKLGSCIAYPRRVPCPRPITDAAIVANDKMVIGQEGGVTQIQIDPVNGWIIVGAGATDMVALASLVAAELGKIKDAIAGLKVTSGAGSGGTVASTSPYNTVANVAATVLKAK